MNQFIYIVQRKTGQIHIGTLQADSGSDAKDFLKKQFPNLMNCDLKGVTSKKHTDHTITCMIETNPYDQPGQTDPSDNTCYGA